MGFIPFPRLAPEIRALIRNWAPLDEASERVVYFERYEHHIVPTRHLISPLLSVCADSRGCALRFFNMHLPVIDLLFPEQETRDEELDCC